MEHGPCECFAHILDTELGVLDEEHHNDHHCCHRKAASPFNYALFRLRSESSAGDNRDVKTYHSVHWTLYSNFVLNSVAVNHIPN